MGLTQRALADGVLVSFQAISAWERGLSIPDLENAVRIANYFGVALDALLAESDQALFVGIDGGGTKTDLVLTDEAALDKLPGIGEVLAERIIEFRSEVGLFRLPEDLMMVKGIGEKKFADIMEALNEPLVTLTDLE